MATAAVTVMVDVQLPSRVTELGTSLAQVEVKNLDHGASASASRASFLVVVSVGDGSPSQRTPSGTADAMPGAGSSAELGERSHGEKGCNVTYLALHCVRTKLRELRPEVDLGEWERDIRAQRLRKRKGPKGEKGSGGVVMIFRRGCLGMEVL